MPDFKCPPAQSIQYTDNNKSTWNLVAIIIFVSEVHSVGQYEIYRSIDIIHTYIIYDRRHEQETG